MMWFDKKNPDVLYADIRSESHTLCDGRALKIAPDVVLDFRYLPFVTGYFKLVVLDPPHLISAGSTSWLALKYGTLNTTWKVDLRIAFEECWRVLGMWGTLIFKWNEDQVRVQDVVHAIGRKPMFGHPTGRNGNTKWLCYLKTPEGRS
jgi:hypothetical protein